MTRNSPRWLDVVRHRARGFRAPCLLVVQHHAIPATTRLAAPVSLPLPGDMDILAPRLIVDGKQYRARVLDMSAVPNALFGETVTSLLVDRDAIMGALAVILHGYPVGFPR